MKTRRFLSFAACVSLISSLARATFDCGSTGSDGALTFTAPGTPTVIEFDPASFDPPLDPDHDGVYHFTSVNVPPLLTLHFSLNKVGASAIRWLCQGTVTIDGTLDFSGQAGQAGSLGQLGIQAIPGPGGFFSGPARLPGFGPGQPPPSYPSNGGIHAGNLFLIPLIGGNGGNGASPDHLDYFGSGGGGGGAFLLASNSTIQVGGALIAAGGHSGDDVAGGGAGGSLRIAAPSVSGSGTLDVRGGTIFNNAFGWPPQNGQGGVIRIESLNDAFSGQIPEWPWNSNINSYPAWLVKVSHVTLLQGTQLYSADPASLPSVRLLSVGGISLPAKPTGAFTMPDVVINTGQPLLFELEATNVPLGTVMTVYLLNETGSSNVSFTTSGLAGTVANSTASATSVVPPGYTHGFIFGSW